MSEVVPIIMIIWLQFDWLKFNKTAVFLKTNFQILSQIYTWGNFLLSDVPKRKRCLLFYFGLTGRPSDEAVDNQLDLFVKHRRNKALFAETFFLCCANFIPG